MVEVYGGILDTNTGEEFCWPDLQAANTILAQLKSVNPQYGTGWTYAGDCGLQDGNIHISNGADSQTFDGKNAVKNAIDYLEAIL